MSGTEIGRRLIEESWSPILDGIDKKQSNNLEHLMTKYTQDEEFML